MLCQKVVAIYLLGLCKNSKSKKLKLLSFICHLEHDVGKDRYQKYEYMVVKIEDCIDVLTYWFPHFSYTFELDYLRGHNQKEPNGL